MKKPYLLFLIATMQLIMSQARLNGQCVRAISTNPNNPSNPELATINPGLTNQFLNTFDWGAYDASNVIPIYLNHQAQWNIATY